MKTNIQFSNNQFSNSQFSNNNINLLIEDNNDLFSEGKVTISSQQRGGKKHDTLVAGLAEDLDLPKILSYLKKTLNCSGSIIQDKDYGEIILLSGDQKAHVQKFLVDEEIISASNIIIKGI